MLIEAFVMCVTEQHRVLREKVWLVGSVRERSIFCINDYLFVLK
jgi:hypothetical protein